MTVEVVEIVQVPVAETKVGFVGVEQVSAGTVCERNVPGGHVVEEIGGDVAVT
jgi:hypothetical protein